MEMRKKTKLIILEENKEQIEIWLSDGLKQKEISEKLNVKQSQLSLFIKNENLKNGKMIENDIIDMKDNISYEEGLYETNKNISIIDDDKEELNDVEVLDKKKKKNVHMSNNSGNNEWFTPPHIIEICRKIMGSIDLDPATTDFANERIKAKVYYTIETNGLDKEWLGNVYTNPPYSKNLIKLFVEKIINERKNYNQCCVLINNATETKWMQDLVKRCDAICFLKGRVKYLDETGQPKHTPLQGQSIVYFGYNISKFFEELNGLGVCLTRKI
jgi:phage N-6-adenine-methyltransferase